MMNFIILTASFTVGALLASAVSCLIIFKLMNHKRVIDWYTRQIVKINNQIMETVDSIEDEKQ